MRLVRPFVLARASVLLRGTPASTICLWAFVGSLTGCSDTPLVAVDGSRIDLTTAATIVAADGGTTTVSALVTEGDGTFAENGTTVAFIVTGGEVCLTEDPACKWTTVAITPTKAGIASALIRSGVGSSMTVQARSGSITASKDISISSLVAPANAKLLVQAVPDTVPVNTPTKVVAFVSTPDGAPVPNATRIVFSTSAGTLSRAIALTQDGFASSTLTVPETGTVTVTVTSGSAQGAANVLVK